MTRLLLVDEHDITRRGIRDLLRARARMEVVAEARTGSEAMARAIETSPRIVITGYSLPDMSGCELVFRLREIFPLIRVLVYTMHRSERIVLESMHAGASGVVVKTDPPAELLAALDSVGRGRCYVSGSFADTIRSKDWSAPSRHGRGPITEREREVMRLIAQGKNNRRIAESLVLSIKTVESHRSSLMRKLELRSAADVVRFALRNDIVAV